MELHTNQELAQAVNDAIKESGYKKVFIAEKLGMYRETFARFMQKKQFSIDDANKVLDLIGYQTKINVVKIDNKS